MIDLALLSLFIPTFFFVSITPGLCMTLAMTLGMTHGYRKTLYMMIGELLGVALVAILAVLGVATFLMQYPQVFSAFKVLGACYLTYLGLQMWRSTGAMAVHETNEDIKQKISRSALFSQGFITAIANPKGWAFMVSLLPPFINEVEPLAPQLAILIGVIMASEFISMSLYATGGKKLRKLLSRGQNISRLNKISGGLMVILGVWLVIS